MTDATIQSPVFEFTTSNISLQDMPISILLNVSVLPYSIDQGLSALVLVDPNMAYFDRGFFNGYTWSFGPADFGRVLLYLPQHYLGSVRLNATAYNGLQTTNVYLSIYVQPVPTAPNLVVNSPICFNQSDQMIHITIIASLVDTNASETLYVYISNVSKYLTISNLTRNSKNEYVFNATQIPVTQLQVTGTFTTIGSLNMTVSAQAVLLTNGNKAYNNVSVVINACGKDATLYRISTFHRTDVGTCIVCPSFSLLMNIYNVLWGCNSAKSKMDVDLNDCIFLFYCIQFET